MATAAKKEETTTKEIASQLADTAVLDLAFALDCTGSMGSYIQNAQAEIRNIVEAIVAAEKADVRFALVSYRDHPPQDSSFITQVFPFTKSISKMKEHLSTCSAHGGGDGPEAVEDALHDVLKLDWRPEATKICVLICDAPPHGLDPNCGDGFPNGCPLDIDPVVTCSKMAEAGITLYVAGCEPALNPYKDFFTALAHKTGGQYCPLSGAAGLSGMIVHGAREEISLARVMADVTREVEAMPGLSTEAQAARVHEALSSRGVQTRQVQVGTAAMAPPSAAAVAMAAQPCLADIRKEFRPAAGVAMYGPPSAYGVVGAMAYGTGAALFAADMPPPPPPSGAPMMAYPSAPAAYPMAMPMAMGGMPAGMAMGSAPAAPAAYSSAMADVSPAQCMRMVTKARAQMPPH